MTRREEQMVKIHQHAMKNQKRAFIEKACSYLYTKTKMSGTEINKFRKAMEE